MERLPINATMYVKAKGGQLVVPIEVPNEVWTLCEVTVIEY